MSCITFSSHLAISIFTNFVNNFPNHSFGFLSKGYKSTQGNFETKLCSKSKLMLRYFVLGNSINCHSVNVMCETGDKKVCPWVTLVPCLVVGRLKSNNILKIFIELIKKLEQSI